MRYITIEVTCIACGKLIASPSDADMELFRLGYPIHDNSECKRKFANRLMEQLSENQKQVADSITEAGRVAKERGHDIDTLTAGGGAGLANVAAWSYCKRCSGIVEVDDDGVIAMPLDCIASDL